MQESRVDAPHAELASMYVPLPGTVVGPELIPIL